MVSLYQIRSKYFAVGFEVSDGVVTKAAPIISYMKGWTPEQVLSYCRSKKWLCDWVL